MSVDCFVIPGLIRNVFAKIVLPTAEIPAPTNPPTESPFQFTMWPNRLPHQTQFTETLTYTSLKMIE